jgi:glutamine synthetase
VIAACLFAGIDGIKRELDPGPPLEGDAYALPPEEQGDPLPTSLAESIAALEADELLCEAVGADIIETFVAVKGYEVVRHSQHVSDWEIDEYLHHL